MTLAPPTTYEDQPERTGAPRSALACRRIDEADIGASVALLTAGFPEREARYWRRGLERLRQRTVPEGRPRYGYVLTDDGRLVGIILLLFAMTEDGTERANVSSWYVEPAYRGFSHLLLAQALKLRGITLYNMSPAPHTIETVTAQGFLSYAKGTSFVLAGLGRPVPGVHIRHVDASTHDASDMLLQHALWGCLCFEVVERETRHPFIFVRTHCLRDMLPCAQLVYCPSLQSFGRFAGPLGRSLARHGLPIVAVDGPRSGAGLPSLYRKQRGRRIYRGVTPPRIGDLAYSELVIFGP